MEIGKGSGGGGEKQSAHVLHYPLYVNINNRGHDLRPKQKNSCVQVSSPGKKKTFDLRMM